MNPLLGSLLQNYHSPSPCIQLVVFFFKRVGEDGVELPSSLSTGRLVRIFSLHIVGAASSQPNNFYFGWDTGQELGTIARENLSSQLGNHLTIIFDPT